MAELAQCHCCGLGMLTCHACPKQSLEGTFSVTGGGAG